MKVAYFGREGSYSHQVAIERFGTSARFVSCPTHPEVVRALLSRKAEAGVLPLENSIAGVVMETIDTLLSSQFAHSKFKIQEYLDLAPELALLIGIPPGTLTQQNQKTAFVRGIRRLYTHPYPARYLSDWIRKHLPKAELFETVSTSEAAQLASEQPGTAAIAGPHAAKIYDLDIAFRKLSKPNEYITRFCVISAKPINRAPPTHAAICFGLHHRPGSLVNALTILSQHHLNLTRILSRPQMYRTGKFEPNTYVFWVDIDIGKSKQAFACALEQLRVATTFMDILGLYTVRPK
ncbi:MAG: prephenate dehydratase domain-containing protein [Verrucomicrobiae bacterium]|nr:prephenate dehydratase domain-containing protein [Verrucomicrobiae bacterium]